MNQYIFLQRIQGPAMLLTFGVAALLDQWRILSFGRSWPLYLIVLGVIKLAQRAALATALRRLGIRHMLAIRRPELPQRPQQDQPRWSQRTALKPMIPGTKEVSHGREHLRPMIRVTSVSNGRIGNAHRKTQPAAAVSSGATITGLPSPGQ